MSDATSKDGLPKNISATPIGDDDLLIALGIVKDESDKYGGYYCISFDGIESGHLHESTLNELVKRVKQYGIKERIDGQIKELKHLVAGGHVPDHVAATRLVVLTALKNKQETKQ